MYVEDGSYHSMYVYKCVSIVYTLPSSSLQFNHLSFQPSTLTPYPPIKSSIIMRFSATILAFAASASAVAVPRATADYWLARVSQYDDANLSTSVTASFKSEANPNDSRFASFTCIIDDKETPNWCDRDGVSADFDGKSKFKPRYFGYKTIGAILESRLTCSSYQS